MNFQRRKFLRLLLLGGGTFLLGLLGKFFSPVSSLFSGSKSRREKDFKNFKVIEEKDKLIFIDKTGEEILILDRGVIEKQ